MRFKIIGKQDDVAFLVTIDGKKDGYAKVIDLEQGTISEPFRLQSILARGYWEPYEGTREELDGLLSQVKEAPWHLSPIRSLRMPTG